MQLTGQWAALDGVLRDAFYTLLSGLDGAGAIGDVQHAYCLHAEDGAPIGECGDIEAAAWECFHGANQVAAPQSVPDPPFCAVISGRRACQ